MAAGNDLSEEHLATMLKNDARESTAKYSALGIDALLSKRPTSNAPKPNTRFLKHLIRDTDNHNAALKAKETEEAASRLRRLHSRANGYHQHCTSQVSRQSEGKRLIKRQRFALDKRLQSEEVDHLKHRRKSQDSRHRAHVDSHEEVHAMRPHRDYLGTEGGRSQKQEQPSSHYHQEISHKRDDHRREDRRVMLHGSRERKRNAGRGRSRSPTQRSYQDYNHRRRSLELSDDDKHNEHSFRTRRNKIPNEVDLVKAFEDARRRRNMEAKEKLVPNSDDDRIGSLSKVRGRSSNNTKGCLRFSTPQESRKYLAKKETTANTNSDSDPLEAIIGPLPPRSPPEVKKRGRGANKATSGIDARFADSYDPTVDIQATSETEDDWDQALEALRDRQMWKKQGAERLRAAGFTEEEVSSWQKGGSKNEEDVKWNAKGEGREWDRGKVMDSTGLIDTRPEWGRLKGTE